MTKKKWKSVFKNNLPPTDLIKSVGEFIFFIIASRKISHTVSCASLEVDNTSTQSH